MRSLDEPTRAEHQAATGLASALATALELLNQGRRHYGVLIDELFVPGYAETAAGSDLGDHLDAAAQQIRAAQRAARVIETGGGS